MKSVAAVVLAILSWGALGGSQAADAHRSMLPKFGVPVGSRFPLDGLRDLGGHAIPREKLETKILLVNFFSTECAPCIWEVPTLNQVKVRRRDLNVLAITPDSSEAVSRYLRKYGLTWQVAANAEALVLQHLNVKAYPAFALLDPQGRLLATAPAYALGGADGRATVEGIEAWINAQTAQAKR